MNDIEANRRAIKWSQRELLGRILWSFVYPLFRFSPRPFFWSWRRMLLRFCGANIGRNVHIYPTARIAIPWNLQIEADAAVGDRVILYSLGPIKIGARATISQGAHLCAGTHDWRDHKMPLVKSPIEIGADAWVCADAFIGPNVTIGEGAIVGARSLIMKNVPPRNIVSGNPSQMIGMRESV